MEGREALLTIDDMEGVDAYEALSLLGFEHGGAQEMGRRLIASKPDVRLFGDVCPKTLPLVIFVPNIRALKETPGIGGALSE